MKMNLKQLGITMVLLIGLAVPTVARAERIRATLTGYEEVPAVSTDASGEFRGRISRDEQSIDYELTYSGLQGAVRQAHIHFAQLSVNGSIVVWLCGTVANPGPAGTPACPPSGTVSGTITAAQVIGSSATQQLAPGDLGAVIAAMRARAAYVNVHTTISPGGEVRGQIRASHHGGND
jgi:hypothetical protein